MRIKRFAYAAGLTMLLGQIAAADDLAVFRPQDSMVFPANKVEELLHQCSRGTPGPVQGEWAPSPQQIAELEDHLRKDFPAALEKWASKLPNRQIPQKAVEYFKRHGGLTYFRQYGGVVIAGKKIIYVNAFYGGPEDPYFGAAPPADWHDYAISMCDGGEYYFGVEYNIEERRLRNFYFNGIG